MTASAASNPPPDRSLRRAEVLGGNLLNVDSGPDDVHRARTDNASDKHYQDIEHGAVNPAYLTFKSVAKKLVCSAKELIPAYGGRVGKRR